VSLLLDTHVLVWWLQGEGPLSAQQTDALEQAEAAGDPFVVAAISLWEIAKLIERGRLEWRGSPDVLLEELEAHPRLAVLPLSARIAIESTRLGAAFHRDPADQLIVATARVHGCTLVTADDRIRRSNTVPVI
jgi:PIN domain nuclease of toxin-antitoxin system